MIALLKETWFHFSLKLSPAKNRDYDNGLTMENRDHNHDLSIKNRDYDHVLTMKNHDWPWFDRVKTVIDHDLTMKNRDYDNGLTTKTVIMITIWPWKTVIMAMVWPRKPWLWQWSDQEKQ